MYKIKERHIKGLMWLFYIVFILLVLGLFFKVHLSTKILTDIVYIGNKDEEQFIHDFISGTEIKQEFSCYTNFDFIRLSFNHHDKINIGKIGIQIIDKKSGQSLIYIENDMEDLDYFQPVLDIFFDEIGGGKADKIYEIKLWANDTEETAVGVYGYKTKDNPAIVNGKISEYALSIGVHQYTNIFRWITYIILAISIMNLIITGIVTLLYSLKEEYIFLLLSIPFVIAMLLLWPGNSVYDETRHYHTVYNFSNGLLGLGKTDNITKIKMRHCDVIDEEDRSLRGRSINSQAHDWGYYTKKIWDDDSDIVLIDISKSPVVQNGTFIEYLPLTIGMTIGRLLGMNYFWMMTLSRVVNLLCCLGLCYYSIYNTPVLKSLFVLLCALPMNLYQMSGVSYDGITFSIGIVVFSFIVKLWKDGLSNKEYIRLILFSVILGACKGGVYLTLLMLLFFIPKEKFIKNKWKKIIIIISLSGISMLISFLPVLFRWFGIGDNINNSISSISNFTGKLHISYALLEPVEFIKMVIITLINNIDMYIGQALGYRTAWANTTISEAVMLPFLILLILASLKGDNEEFKIGLKERAGILCILILEILGMHALFLTDTPVYSNIIVGCQGRYFIIFIPCILLLFRNDDIVYRKKREYLYLSFCTAQLVYLYFFLEIFMCA